MVAQLPTRDDYFQVGAAEVLSRSAQRPKGQRISREAVFTEGTDINIIIAACSAMADEATRQLAMRMAVLFLDSAEGEDLDRLVADRFSPTIIRKQASKSVLELQFSRAIPPSNGDPVTYDVGDKFATATGTEYELTEVVSLKTGSTGPVTARAQAILAGTGGNAAAGQVTTFVGPNPDPNVSVTNPEPAAGGRNVEGDGSLRNRAREFYNIARRATLSAIESGALTVQGVESATSIEETDEDGLPTGRVSLAIADSDGRSNQTMADAVKIALLEFRAAGIIVDILASTPSFQTIEYQVAFRDNINQRNAISQLKSLTVNAVNLLEPSEPLQRSLLFSLARSVPGIVVNDTSVQSPAGDVIPLSNQTLKTSFDRVTVNGL